MVRRSGIDGMGWADVFLGMGREMWWTERIDGTSQKAEESGVCSKLQSAKSPGAVQYSLPST